jgi:hypothetical protein
MMRGEEQASFMSDDNNTVDLTFLAKQPERILDQMAEMRGEMTGMQSDIAELKATQQEQGESLVKVTDAVTSLAEQQTSQSAVIAKIHEGQMIIERDLSAIKMRVARIERHTGLVQAQISFE